VTRVAIRDMQVNVITERKVTKILGMLAAIHEHLGLADEEDDELAAMQDPTPIDHVARTVEAADEEQRRSDA
jgi:hypothetical protein